MDFIWAHLIIAVLLTGYFLYRFVRDRETYQLLFVIWIPSTLLTYLSSNTIFHYILIAFQLIMFILVLYFMFRKPKTDEPEKKPEEDSNPLSTQAVINSDKQENAKEEK